MCPVCSAPQYIRHYRPAPLTMEATLEEVQEEREYQQGKLA